jgi:hypothetical protein
MGLRPTKVMKTPRGARTPACCVHTLQKVARKLLIPFESAFCDFLALKTAPSAVSYSCERLGSVTKGVHMSDGRSLAGTSLAAESSLFRHPDGVYFRATACFDLHSLYTRAFASFLESKSAALRLPTYRGTSVPT